MCQMSPEIKDLAAALAMAQSEFTHAKKDSENPFFRSRYADLTAIIESIKLPLSKNGLSYTQVAEYENDTVGVTTILMHKSGQWLKGTLRLKPVKTDPQACGSAITYARRYSLQSIVGLSAEEDDDGNKASVKPTTTPVAPANAVISPTINDLHPTNTVALPENKPVPEKSVKPELATTKQRGLIFGRGKDRGWDEVQVKTFVDWFRTSYHPNEEKLSKKSASELIDNWDDLVQNFKQIDEVTV